MYRPTHPSLVDRVVIVTGGGRGLGRVMALALVQAGAKVVVTGARSTRELDATVADGRLLGRGSIDGLVADVSDRAACDEVVRFATDRFGPVEVLVNNAARAPAEQNLPEAPDQRAKFWMMPHEAILRLLVTNVGGVWAMAQAVLPGMIARGRGKIVNISTSRPTMVYQTSGIYGPCKAAVEASSRIWA
ncbi:MAG: SDR family oxidoreductase, partial [Sphingomonadaceae bacterium]|nr:SDR family oxidoreductase [Sphingomonadaceae bacterium]